MKKATIPTAYVPRHLGRQSRNPVTQVDRIPWRGGPLTVSLFCQDFTALCPVTGQPDFGRLTIEYVPRRHIVETKSLKLYLQQFREEGIFNEVLVARIADDLYAQLRPRRIEVVGAFAARGGIQLTARAVRP